MVQITEQVAAMNKSQLESAAKVAEIASDGLEKLAELQYKAIKTVFADGLKTARQFSTIKDSSEFAALGNTFAQPAWEKAQAYAKSVYDVAATTQVEMSTWFEQQVGEYNKNLLAVLDGAAKNAPAGTEGAMTAIKSVVQSTTAAFESVLKATKQVAAAAESSAAGMATPVRRKAA
jgi:phasin family protein